MITKTIRLWNMLSVLFGGCRKQAFTVAAAILTAAVQAAEVTGDMALAAAEAWSAENRTLSGKMGSPDSVKECRGDDGTLLWYEVAMSGGCCVVASADTEIEPIVAVIDRYDGEIPEGHPLKAMLKLDMRGRLGLLKAKSSSKVAATAASSSGGSVLSPTAARQHAMRKWAKLSGCKTQVERLKVATKSDSGKVMPVTLWSYIGEWSQGKLDHWNQNGWNKYVSIDSLYDKYTPNHYPCGCVATAGAALIQFFGVTTAPSVTRTCYVDGVARSLTTKGGSYDWTLFSSFGWRDDVELTAGQVDLLGRVTYDMGVSLGISYAKSGSSASIYTLARVLRNDYGLADARYVGDITSAEYEKLIYNQVRCGRPVVLSIRDDDSGHAVLAVGYGEDEDSTAYTRIFMGWGGSSDAWYALPNVAGFQYLAGVVTMIGKSSSTVPLCARITTTAGGGAAFEEVSVNGYSGYKTTAYGFLDALRGTSAATYTVSCRGQSQSVYAGSGLSTIKDSYSASNLASLLPDTVVMTVPATSGELRVYGSPLEAQAAAFEQGKALFVLSGADWCGYCGVVKNYLKGLGAEFTDRFVLYYANIDCDPYGMGYGAPSYAVFDPRAFDYTRGWTVSNGRLAMDSGGVESKVQAVLEAGSAAWQDLCGAPIGVQVSGAGGAVETEQYALRISFSDGTEASMVHGVAWSLTSGDAAVISTDGKLTPVAGRTGDVTVSASVTLWGKTYTRTKVVRIVERASITGILISGPSVIDLYDVAGGQYHAFARCNDGTTVEVSPSWSVSGDKINYMKMSTGGELYFSYDNYTVYQCATATVTAAYGAFTAVSQTEIFGPGYVSIAQYDVSQNAVWPGGAYSVTPKTVRWWRHGILEEPTSDLSDVVFGWSLRCPGDQSYSGDGTSFTVPSSAFSTNGECTVVITATPDRKRYYSSQNRWLYPRFFSAKPQMVSLTFDGNGGEPTTQTMAYAVGYPYGSFPNVSKKGYYNYWYTAAEGGARMTTSSNCLASVTRLYAQWKPQYYWILYDPNGGTGSISESCFYYDSPANLRKNTFTKSGAMFAGWATSPDGPVVYQDGEEILNLSSVYAEIKLYAVWSTDFYTVTFDANGGAGAMASLQCAVGSCITLPDCAFNRAGYTFAGWAESSGGAWKYTAGSSVCGLATSAGASIKLYAAWNADSFAVTLNPQGGSGGTTSVTATYGSPMPTITVPKRSGYIFGGYFTSIGGGGTQYYTASGTSAQAWDRTGATTLYAKWTQCYAVSYVPGEHGTGETKTVGKEHGVALTLDGAIFTRTGYTQTGWAASDGGVKVYDVGATYTVNAAVTLYPVWTANTYAVALDAQGGSGGTASVMATYGSPMPAIAVPTLKDFIFGGYFTSIGGGGTQYYTASGASAQAWDRTGATTLYAKWTQGYAVSYVPGDHGTGEVKIAGKEHDVALALEGAIFTRTGYTQTGWATSDGGAKEYDFGATYTANAAVTLYPVWTANTYNVKFYANGGTGSMQDLAMTYDVAKNLPANGFAKSASVFAGWATSANGSVAYADGASVVNLTAVQGGTVALYAKWTQSYAVSYVPGEHGTGEAKTVGKEHGVALTLEGAIFTRTGYTQTGWAKSDGGVRVYDIGATYTVNAAITLYPVWTANMYAVALDAQGGSGGTASVTATYGSPMPAITVPTLKDCVFGGYFTSVGGGGTQYYTASGASAQAWDRTDTTTLYAKWTQGYAISYVPGDHGMGEFKIAGKEHDVALALEGAIFTRTGYTQTGWATSDGGAKEYDFGATYTANAAVTLYPVWTANTYNVKFYANGGTGSMQDLAMTYDVAKNLPANGFAKSASVFAGWATSANGSVVYADGASVVNLTAVQGGTAALYAKWTSVTTYIVSYKRGTYGIGSQLFVKKTHDVPLDLAGAIFTRTGYTQTGWAESDGGVKVYDLGVAYAANAAVMFYPFWTANQYIVTFDANGGEVSPGSKQVEYDSEIGELPTPTRDGYMFVGWQVDGGEIASDTIYETAGDSVSLAQWMKLSDPDPMPDPDPTPDPEPTPLPDPTPVPDPTPAPGPTPDSTPEPEEMPELYEDVDGAAPAVASEYNGYLFDAKGNAKGTIQVKVGKPGKKDGAAAVKASVVLGANRVGLKAAGNGKAVINANSPTEIALVGGETCAVVFGEDGISGTYGAYFIDGARNFFASKSGGEAANTALGKWLGPVSVVWNGGSVNVSIAKKGKVKVKGTLADGKTKVSAKAAFLVGEEWCAVPVVAQKASLAFTLWLSCDGRTAVVEGLGDGAIAGKPGTLAANAAFHVSKTAELWSSIAGTVLTDYIPDGMKVASSGGKWVLPKAGKVVYKNGEVDKSKLGENPSALKLTYKAKDGSFKGSFKVYAVNGGKAKATTVNVTGVMAGTTGYGTATIKGKGSVSVTVK